MSIDNGAGIGRGKRFARGTGAIGLWGFLGLVGAGAAGLAFGGSGGCSFSLDPRTICTDQGCTNMPSGNDMTSGGPDLAPDVDNPGKVGPFSVASRDEAPSGIGVSALKIYSPSSGTAGARYPLVVLAPSSFGDVAQLDAYAMRLASHGMHAALFRVGSDLNQQLYRDSLVQLMKWIIESSGIKDQIDGAQVGLAGFQLGGKISIAAAVMDSRVRAVLAIDPVDVPGVQGWVSGAAVASMLTLPADNPLVILGESKTMSPCIGAGTDYSVFFTNAKAPASAILFGNAAHGDFVPAHPDNSCMASAQDVHTLTQDLAIKYTTAYFQYTLRGRYRSRDYLFGKDFDADKASGALTRTDK